MHENVKELFINVDEDKTKGTKIKKRKYYVTKMFTITK